MISYVLSLGVYMVLLTTIALFMGERERKAKLAKRSLLRKEGEL